MVDRRVPIDRQDKEQWGVRSGFQDFLSLRIVCQHLPDEIVEASQWCRQATNVLFLLLSQQPLHSPFQSVAFHGVLGNVFWPAERKSLVRSRRTLPFAVRMLGARHLPPRFDELVAHMKRVLPLRYTDERPEEAEEGAPAGSGGVLGIERDVARL